MVKLMVFRVMLVNPPVFRVEEPWWDTPNFVRVSLAYLAGFLRQFPGFEIKALDCKYERINFDDALQRILDFKPNILGLGAMTNEIKPAAYLAKLVKEKSPKTTIVIGDVHVTALPKRTLQEFPQFDIGVVGEGEITFHELCTALRDKKPLNNINGLVYKSEKGIEVTSPRERILNQDMIPFPAWDLFPSAEEYVIKTQRGCPFNCHFCMNPQGRVARTRSVENLMEELEMLVEKHQMKKIQFGDELFSVDMERTKQILKAMIKLGIHKRASFFAQTHVRFVDEELFRLMKKANVDIIGMGIETGDEETLTKMGKGTSLKMILAAMEAAKKAKVPITTFFIIGQPNETVDTIKKTIDLAVKLNPAIPIFGIMSPYPGTEVARLAARGEAGYRLVTTDWDEYNKQLGGALEFANLTRSQIERMQVMAYVKVFLENHRYLDFVKFLWHYRTGGISLLKKWLHIRAKKIEFEESKKYRKIDEEGIKEIAAATSEWQALQVSELGRAKKLLKEKITVKHV